MNSAIVIHVDTEAFRPKPYVRDIGIVLDDTMDMDRHVSHTCRLAYHHLRSLANVRNSLTTTACETMVLGPLLFIIYINDLPEASNIFKFITYADDTTLFSPCKYFNSITRENNDIGENINK